MYTIIYQINTENLHAGLTVNNYKEMCKLLGDGEKTSNSKKAQITEWNRYFKFRREGHKYIIEEVYNPPLFKQVRKGSNTAGFIEELICSDALFFVEGGCYITAKQMLFSIGIVSQQYEEIDRLSRTDAVELSKRLEIREESIFDFSYFSSNYFRRIIKDALNSMQRRELCSFSEEYQIVNWDYWKYIANDSEKERISAAKQRVADEMKIESIKSVFNTGRSKEFYNRLKKKLNALYGWQNAYKIFHITFVAAPSLIDDEARLKLKKELNHQVIAGFNQHFEKMIQDAQAEAKKEQYDVEGNFWGVRGLMGKYSYRLTPSQYGLSYEQEIKSLIEKYIQIKTDISHL